MVYYRVQSHQWSVLDLVDLINVFIGVEDDNLSDLWLLYVIQAACSLLPLVFIWLVPNKAEVEAV